MDPGLAKVVDAGVEDVGEALEARVAVDLVHPPQDHLGGGTGELSEGLVDLGQQGGAMGCVSAREPVRRRLPAAIADVAGAAVLGDEAGDLGPGQARHLLQVPLHQPLLGLAEPVVREADQRAAHEGVGGGPVW
ncbi:hypothetical protein [Candidatus Palauibacter soopunensis]|uniref:hypothetical protein n=1 Tax=Candidatus Palauibacter soopunensis TaxID=3056739 RepID=UPI00238982F9|nr:hypothetical protein [Candidatus Palauibacter soopunensis]MDE2878841.1 hypothetical protein [Candidatus Palauibacter soopunensis]